MPNDFDQLNMPLTKQQKIALTVLSFFSVLVVVAWGMQLKKNINDPLAGNTTSQTTAAATTPDDAKAAADAEALKKKDTDGDGLSDYDELNIYHTSPYLTDTDSDGFTDKQEIDAGHDPLCPAGRQCSGTQAAASTSDVTNPTSQNTTNPVINNDLYNNLATPNAPTDNSVSAPAVPAPSILNNTANVNSSAAQNILGGQADVKVLRQALLDAGMDKTLLDKISDADLLKSYNSTLNTQGQ
jgi:hypothetical protein